MKIDFYKYQGTGNDFIMIDNRFNKIDKNLKMIQFLCDRKFGIGSDGLIFIEEHPVHDFLMDFYNPDGSQSFCGNGSRCSVAFANFLGMIAQKTTFEAIDGIHDAEINDNYVKVKMADISEVESSEEFDFLNTGSPHVVKVVDDVASTDIVEYGRSIRYNDRFKTNGTNVNVIQRLEDGIKMRTYERGVEDETLSCGTGVTASALVAIKNEWFSSKVKVKTLGGDLEIEAEKATNGFQNIWLCGPAKFVYKGEVNV